MCEINSDGGANRRRWLAGFAVPCQGGDAGHEDNEQSIGRAHRSKAGLLAGRSRGVGHGLRDAGDQVGHGLLLRLGEGRIAGKRFQACQGVRI